VNNVQTIVVANVNNPVFATAQDLSNPDLEVPDVSNATIALAPNENAQITIRATVTSQTDLQNDVLSTVAPVVVSHAVNTQDALNGSTTPPATVVITSSATLPDGVRGNTYTATLGTFGGFGTLHFASNPLAPAPGLTLDPLTGAITGTPTQSGTFTFTVTVTDSTAPTANTFVRVFTLVIAEPLVITTTALPDGVVGIAYSATVTSTGGTAPITWSATGLPPGLSINAGTGAITGTPTTANISGAIVVVSATDSSANPQTASRQFTLRVAPVFVVNGGGALPDAIFGQQYSATIPFTGGIPPVTLSVSGQPAGLTLTGNVLSGVVTGGPGTFNVTVTGTDSSSPQQTSTAVFTLRVSAALSIVTTKLPQATVKRAYTATLAASGGVAPYTWSLIGALPPGLTLSPGGVISGVPTKFGLYNFTVKVTDSENPPQSATRPLSILVCTSYDADDDCIDD
jgi:hypothetical protein